MKLIPCILSLYIFALAVSPCTDGIECGMEHTEHQEHNHSEHEDTCTPFCTCNCCGITIGLAQIMNPENFDPNHNYSYNFHYSFFYTHDYQNKVWHPPLV